MNQPKQSEIEQILETPVDNIQAYRNHWLIQTKDRKWIVKKIKYPTRLRWLLDIDKELRYRGFISMPQVQSDRKEWLLTSFIKGKVGRYTNIDEVVKMIRVLAHFHYVGRGLITPPDGAAYLLYHRLYERLFQYYQILKNADQVEGELGKLLKNHGKDFFLEGIKTWEKLRWYPFTKLNLEEWWMQYLTHRDLASHNWIIDQKGKPWLIDFDAADYDCQLADVWQMSSRILTQNSWSDQWSYPILSAYEEVRPLSDLEKKLIYLLLSFPNEFFREVIGLVKKKQGYTFRSSLSYLKKIVQTREDRNLQLKSLFYW
jgi:CotS family spore coat protein